MLETYGRKLTKMNAKLVTALANKAQRHLLVHARTLSWKVKVLIRQTTMPVFQRTEDARLRRVKPKI